MFFIQVFYSCCHSNSYPYHGPHTVQKQYKTSNHHMVVNEETETEQDKKSNRCKQALDIARSLGSPSQQTL